MVLQNDRDAGLALVTYYNYVSAWQRAIELEYDHGQEGEAGLLRSQKALPYFQRLSTNGHSSPETVAAYCRGMLTLRAMKLLPVERFPEVAATANLWLPVQAYYAVHGIGSAVSAILDQGLPTTHGHFRKVYARFLARLLPFPFSATCTRGPLSTDFVYVKLDTCPAKVAAQSNLTYPEHADLNASIGKSLGTTRERDLNSVFSEHRKKPRGRECARRNLKLPEKNRLSDDLTPTTVVDFLWRMRKRSNYENPDMYIAASTNIEDAVEHWRVLTYTTEMLACVLRAVIVRKLGEQTVSDWDSRLPT